MAKDTSPPDAKERPTGLRRALPYLVLAAGLIGFLIWFFSDAQAVRRSINALHSDSQETRKEHLGYLRSHPDKKLVNTALLESVEDGDLAWSVRRMCASELMRRERLPDIARLLKGGDLGTRTVVTDVLSDREFFRNTWAPDPAYRVYETLEEWLQDTGNAHRARAIQLAKLLNWSEGLPFIRPLLRRSGRGNADAKQERLAIEAAASAVQKFGDCESLPQLLELARNDVSWKVRMRAMQEVHRMVFKRDICPGSVSEEDMRALIAARLSDEKREPRMAAMIIYKSQVAWAADSAETLGRYLREEGRANGERRLALEVLIDIEAPEFMQSLPRWFHDDAPEVRSSAAQSVSRYQPKNPYLGSLIGVIRNERESKSAFESATKQLRDAAGVWKGVPAKMAADAVGNAGRRAFQQVLNGLYAAGEAQGVERNTFAAGWFRWHAEQQGLEGDDIDLALAAYEAFWSAADRNDTSAAKAALAADSFGKPKLFEDLRGWLDAQ